MIMSCDKYNLTYMHQVVLPAASASVLPAANPIDPDMRIENLVWFCHAVMTATLEPVLQ